MKTYGRILFAIFALTLNVCAAKIDLIQSVLVLEAANQGEAGMRAVFEVLRNRAGSTQINSLYFEARRPKQFSCLNNLSDRNAIKIAAKSPAWQIAGKIIRSKVKSNLVQGARHYYADWIKPPIWAQGKKTIRIKNHLFLVENSGHSNK